MQAGCNVSELVARWDEDGSDDIDKVEMIQGLRALRIEATDAELGALFDSVIALGPDVSGGPRRPGSRQLATDGAHPRADEAGD